MSIRNVALGKGGRGVAHSFNCPPPLNMGMHLADALVCFLLTLLIVTTLYSKQTVDSVNVKDFKSNQND